MSLVQKIKGSEKTSEKGVKDKMREGDYYSLLEAYNIGDVKEGDLIRVGKDEYLILIGMNKKGDTGIDNYTMDMPAPMFYPTDPRESDLVKYFKPEDLNWVKLGHVTPEIKDMIMSELEKKLADH